jgi:hypothetical protein
MRERNRIFPPRRQTTLGSRGALVRKTSSSPSYSTRVIPQPGARPSVIMRQNSSSSAENGSTVNGSPASSRRSSVEGRGQGSGSPSFYGRPGISVRPVLVAPEGGGQRLPKQEGLSG